MASILLLYRPQSDNAVLSWGSWSPTLPLSNLTLERLSATARSTNVDPSSTRLRVQLPQPEAFQTLVMGPMNVTTSYKYRIRTYADATFGAPVEDTDWVTPFVGTSGDPLELEWEDPDFWLNIFPFDDEERGIYLIHHFPSSVTGQFWSFEIDDGSNPAAFIEIGRLFMARQWAPTINYPYSDNGLSFRNNSLATRTLAAGLDVFRRINARLFRFGLEMEPEDDMFDEGYKFMRAVGFDAEVFVIPDIADQASLQQRSFLGTITAMDPLKQTALGVAGNGFEIEERLS